jgi:hypothetical protein
VHAGSKAALRPNELFVGTAGDVSCFVRARIESLFKWSAVSYPKIGISDESTDRASVPLDDIATHASSHRRRGRDRLKKL